MARLDDVRGSAGDDVQRAASETATRLAARGIRVNGNERPEELVEMLEAVERFEEQVEAHGGDLMVDEAPGGRTTEPDDPHFVLPHRGARESAAEYLERLQRATDDLRRHPPRAD